MRRNYPFISEVDRKAVKSSGHLACQQLSFGVSIVIGSGSLSFELIRVIAERLPFLITPRWVDVPAQPISIIDLLHYTMQLILIVTQAKSSRSVGPIEFHMVI